MIPTVIFGSAPEGYKMVTLGDTPANALKWYNAAIKAGSKKNFVITVNGKHVSLWIHNPHKGKFGQIGWKTVIVKA